MNKPCPSQHTEASERTPCVSGQPIVEQQLRVHADKVMLMAEELRIYTNQIQILAEDLVRVAPQPSRGLL